MEPADRFRIKATAHFADGSSRDVTALTACDFTATGIARITPDGEVIREQLGEVVLLVRYLGQMAAVRIAFLPNRPVPDLVNFPIHNDIDRLVVAQWKELRLAPAALAPDHVFLRRAYLDSLGILPTAEEARAFLADNRADKRDRLIDALLERPEFAEFWRRSGPTCSATKKRLSTARGSRSSTGGSRRNWPRIGRSTSSPATSSPPAAAPTPTRRPTSGEPFAIRSSARIGRPGLPRRPRRLRRCHNHPFDRWTMDDYYGFAACFTRIDYRVLDNNRKDNLDKHEFVGEQIVLAEARRRDDSPANEAADRAAFPRRRHAGLRPGRRSTRGAGRLDRVRRRTPSSRKPRSIASGCT